jgi:small-conductance mechanosensitive channel
MSNVIANYGSWFVGVFFSDAPVDEVESAVEAAQVSGWQVLAAILVLIVAFPIGHLAQRLMKRGLSKAPTIPPEIVYDLTRGARFLVYLSAAAIALVILGVGSSWVAIVIVVVLLVAVLTARPQIENTSAGLVLTARPSFTVGDEIEILGTRGTVLRIGSHSTVLDSVDGVRSYIPNTSMLGEMVHVYTASDARRAQFDMSLAAGTDIAEAFGIISKSLAAADGVLAEPASEVLASQLDEDAMIVTARFWYSSKLKTDIVPVSAAILAVRNALDEAGIELGGATTGIDIANDDSAAPSTTTPDPSTPEDTSPT